MIITICSSMQNRMTIEEIVRDLSLRGHVVLSPVTTPPSIYTDDELKVLKEIHLQRIILCDAIYVIDNNIGESVNAEIAYAVSLSKTVYFHSKHEGKFLV